MRFLARRKRKKSPIDISIGKSAINPKPQTLNPRPYALPHNKALCNMDCICLRRTYSNSGALKASAARVDVFSGFGFKVSGLREDLGHVVWGTLLGF